MSQFNVAGAIQGPKLIQVPSLLTHTLKVIQSVTTQLADEEEKV